MSRPLIAVALLLLVYLGLSFLNDPRGYLGTDTGGKVATLRAMEEKGTLDPDIGYWAERWDPDGRFHPLYYTNHLAGKWVNVTTLPALYAAYPLFRLGGYRGALLVPMAGAVLAALAARALARRLGDGSGWPAFWIVGLASPLAVYALDFWEHSLGVGLVAWGVVLLYDIALGASRRPWLSALGAGLLFGAAATMRTEALVYAAVATAGSLVTLLVRKRRLVTPVLAGVAVIAGLLIPLAANLALERATIGTSLRAERAAGTVQGAVGPTSGQSRPKEAIVTGLALEPSFEESTYLMGAVLLILLLLLAHKAARDGGDPRLARVAFAGVVALYVIRFADGLGFIPGLVAATPLAAFGLAWAWKHPGSRLLAAIALIALPIVWATQYTGGAAPQWAGRYILVSGFLLCVVGVVSLARVQHWVAVGMIVLSALVTAFGLTWLSVRSRDVARTGEALVARPEPVLISRIGHLFREAGWFADDHRWLTARTKGDVEDAARTVVAPGGFGEFALVELDQPTTQPPAIPGFTVAGRDRVEFIDGVPLRIVTYRAVP